MAQVRIEVVRMGTMSNGAPTLPNSDVLFADTVNTPGQFTVPQTLGGVSDLAIRVIADAKAIVTRVGSAHGMMVMPNMPEIIGAAPGRVLNITGA